MGTYNCALHVHLFVAILLVLLLHVTFVRTETRVEVSFIENPVENGTQAGVVCKIWDLGPNQEVGLARLDKNNQNIVLVRNGVLLAQERGNIYLTVIPRETQADGDPDTYHLTIIGTTEEDAGTYSCYVLTVTDTVMAVATDSDVLKVVYLPPEGYPMCSTSSNRLSYYAGDNITLLCSSPDGKPSISLLWIANDGEDILENQIATEQDDLLHRRTMVTLTEEDNGVVFSCMIVSEEFPSNGRECRIGPVAVWLPPATTVPITDYTMVSDVYDNATTITDTSDPRLIFGLTIPIFVMIVVAAGALLLIILILLFIYCCTSYSCTCLVRKRHQKYSMQGLVDHEVEAGAGGTHTLTQSTLDGQYTPARPAPVSPPSKPNYDESVTPVQKRNYTPNSNAQNNAGKRLSAVEQALLLAVTKSMTRDQPSRSSIKEEPDDGEIIYANTSRSSSMIELHKIGNEQEDEDHQGNMDSDSDSGVVNPAYDNNESTFSEVHNPPAPSHSRSASQSEIIYHNTTGTQETEQELALYAKVDKSRSRSSTMESLKARKTVEPEAVTTLDDSVIYHNTAELGINSSAFLPSSPPPIPATPPSPISQPRKELPSHMKRQDYRKRANSLGGPAKPSFKPPPPPSPGPLTRPKSEAVIYGNTSLFGDEELVTETNNDAKPKPKVPPKPKPPKKPTYKI